MELWEEDYLNMEVQAYIKINAKDMVTSNSAWFQARLSELLCSTVLESDSISAGEAMTSAIQLRVVDG
jgi:hypothetical protein